MKNKFWKNKFIIFVCAVIIASFVLCSCKGNENGRKGSPSSTPVPVYSLIPTDVITAGNLKSIVTYEPVCENIKTSENEKTVLYRSEPIGLGDPGEVNVFQ
ncbi:MAG: hypothetical protein J1F64_07570, partial [Oscillospiraceae bacterium]|nr:hypothetical protein [Oscillospiraceae bacterium]